MFSRGERRKLAAGPDRPAMSNDFRHGIEAMIPALRRYARALARDRDLADDLVQDTLVRALRSERLFLGGDLRAWLYTILTNLNRNRRRSLARRPTLTELHDTADASAPRPRPRHLPRAGDAGRGPARSAAAGGARRDELSRRGRHPGRADRHRDVPPRPCPRPCQGGAGRRAAGAAAREMRATNECKLKDDSDD